MVKLFVGNLAETVDSTKLKQVFQQFTKVTECDVVKNYAFVHIEDNDVNSIVSRLNGYTLEGRQIHIQISTSKLRPVPGMVNQCYRCASTLHKTPQCPQDPANQINQTIKIDLTRGLKRPGDSLSSEPAAKMQAPVMNSSGFQIGMIDAEIPRPVESELQQLYEEYHLSRQRYTYYRDRLLKEMDAKKGIAHAYTPMPQHQQMVPTMNSTQTQLSSAPVSYQIPQQQTTYTLPAAPGSHPYSAGLRAPYAAPVVQQGAPYVGGGGGAAPYAVAGAPQQYATQPVIQQQPMIYGQPQQQQPVANASYGQPGQPMTMATQSTVPGAAVMHQIHGTPVASSAPSAPYASGVTGSWMANSNAVAPAPVQIKTEI